MGIDIWATCTCGGAARSARTLDAPGLQSCPHPFGKTTGVATSSSRFMETQAVARFGLDGVDRAELFPLLLRPRFTGGDYFHCYEPEVVPALREEVLRLREELNRTPLARDPGERR